MIISNSEMKKFTVRKGVLHYCGRPRLNVDLIIAADESLTAKKNPTPRLVESFINSLIYVRGDGATPSTTQAVLIEDAKKIFSKKQLEKLRRPTIKIGLKQTEDEAK